MTFLRHCCEMSRLSLGVKERAFSKRCLIAAFKICTLGAPMSFWHRLSNFLASLFDMKKSRWSGNVVWGYGVREMVPTECFENRTKVTFEGEEYDAFSDYDTYLRTVYGDYMTPPPPEKRIGVHVVEAYMKWPVSKSAHRKLKTPPNGEANQPHNRFFLYTDGYLAHQLLLDVRKKPESLSDYFYFII